MTRIAAYGDLRYQASRVAFEGHLNPDLDEMRQPIFVYERFRAASAQSEGLGHDPGRGRHDACADRRPLITRPELWRPVRHHRPSIASVIAHHRRSAGPLSVLRPILACGEHKAGGPWLCRLSPCESSRTIGAVLATTTRLNTRTIQSEVFAW